VGVNTPPTPPFTRQRGRGTRAVRQARAEQYYGGFHISIWQDRPRKRAPCLYLALTPPLPEGKGE
jgi:hypothetical protein